MNVKFVSMLVLLMFVSLVNGRNVEARAKLQPLHKKTKFKPFDLSQQIMTFFGGLPDDIKSSASTSDAPVVGDLKYYGGAVLANVNIVAVMWGDSVDTETTSGIGGFYSSVVDSPYLDWLSEYNTSIQAEDGREGTGQSIGRGTFGGLVQINSSIASDTIDDSNIQTELDAQIASGALPAPDANTLYMIHFPLNAKITQTDSSGKIAKSCEQFCAFHSAFMSSSSAQVNYGVIPDMNSDGCNTGGCGDGDAFGNLTNGASHEMVEAITDSGVGLATGDTAVYPMGWYDNAQGEIGDICASSAGILSGKDGNSYTVQGQWSNAQASCVTGL